MNKFIVLIALCMAPQSYALSSHFSKLSNTDKKQFITLFNEPSNATWYGTWQTAQIRVRYKNRIIKLNRDEHNNINGFIVYYMESRDEGFIDLLGVHPLHQKQGIGTRLLTEAITDMKERGATTVLLCVHSDNTKARSIYERLGFVDIPEIAYNSVSRYFQLKIT